MPGQYCFVCATDEGVFLDVTADNKQIFHKQITDCSLSKAISSDELPAKICHKCAYELKQCSTFVQKYKKGYGSLKRTRNIHRSCCSLCLESAKKSYTFNLNQDNNSLNSPINKLKDIFNYDVDEWTDENILICLHCRYTLDLLSDLKSVCQQTKNRLKNIDEDVDYLNFAKTKTDVVSRKTTITESTRIQLSILSKADSKGETMARGQSRVNKLSNNKTTRNSKLRVCEKCNNFVKTDGDIYRLHSNGLSVCKSCWLTMDSSNHVSDKQKQKMCAQTKSCTVFLKDVLTDNAFKQQKVYRVEEDDHGNKVYIITDDSSECEDKLQKDSATAEVANSTKIGTLRQGQKRSARNVKSNNTNSVEKSNKRFKSNRKQPDTALNEGTSQKQSTTKNTVNVPATLPVQQLGEDVLTQSSDLNTSDKTSRKTGRTSKITHKSLSDVDMEMKRSRVKLRNILHGMPVSRTDVSDDESSSNDEGVSKKKKLKITSVSPVINEADESNEVQPNRAKSSKPSKRQRKTRVLTKKLSNVSLASTASQSTQPMDYDSDVYEVETKNYVCDVCCKTYENKLTYLTHQLKHCKQPEIKLERVCTTNTGTESLSIIDLVDDEREEQLENISITVDDDEEEVHEKNNAIIENTASTVKVSSIQKQTTEEPTVEQKSETENTSLNTSEMQSGEMDEKEESTATELIQEELQCPVKESDVDDAPSDTRSHPDSSKTGDEDSSIQDKEAPKATRGEEVSKECNEENSTIEAEKDRAVGKDTESIQNTPEKEHDEVETTQKAIKESDETQPEDRGDKDENALKKKQNHGQVLNEDEKLQKKTESDEENQEEEKTPAEQIEEKTREEDKQEEKETESNEKNQEEEDAQVEKKDVEETREDDKQEERPEPAKRDDGQTWEEDGEDKENQIQTEDVEKTQKEDEPVTIDVEDKKSDACATNSSITSKPRKKDDRVILDNDESDISRKEEHNGVEEKEVESETEIRIVDMGNSEDSNEQELSDKSTKPIEVSDDDDNVEDQTTIENNKTPEKSKSSMNGKSRMKNDRVSDVKGDSAHAVTEVLQEVIDLATAEVQKRQGSADSNAKKDNYDEAETLENISREIYNTSDMSPFESSIVI